jgi:hypothetical protein
MALIAKLKWITEENGNIPADRLAGLPNNLFNNKTDAIAWMQNAVTVWAQIGYNDVFVISETYTNG